MIGIVEGEGNTLRIHKKILPHQFFHQMVYRKACHFPLELEHKAYWVVRQLNSDPTLVGEKRLINLSSLDEWRSEAYENARLFKEKLKKWHDKRILKREFNIGDKVLLYRSRLRYFAGKLVKHYIYGNPLEKYVDIIQVVTLEVY